MAFVATRAAMAALLIAGAGVAPARAAAGACGDPATVASQIADLSDNVMVIFAASLVPPPFASAPSYNIVLMCEAEWSPRLTSDTILPSPRPCALWFVSLSLAGRAPRAGRCRLPGQDRLGPDRDEPGHALRPGARHGRAQRCHRKRPRARQFDQSVRAHGACDTAPERACPFPTHLVHLITHLLQLSHGQLDSLLC